MNNDYRLQLLSHSEIFPTREEAIEYIEDNFKSVALWGEPALFFYGNERFPKMILVVGASHDSRKPRICIIDDAELRELIREVKEATEQNTEDIAKAAERILNIINVVGLTLDENKIKDQISYDPDRTDELIGEAETVAEAIAIISTFVQRKFKEMELSVEDSNSIDFTLDKTENGTTLTGDVKISTDGNDDDLDFNNNIVGIKTDGLFASCNIEYDAERNRLIFTTSGMKNGHFVTDANKKIIDFGAHTIYTADNEDHSVQVTINQERGTISADVKISSDDDNLLVEKDGKMYVSARAKDIKYKNTNVGAKLNSIDEAIEDIYDKIQVLTIEDLIVGDESDSILTKAIKRENGGYTITSDVRLSSDESIKIGNGGIRANIDINVDTTNNKLILSVGNVQKEVSLPGVSILDNIYYDPVNKTIVITWKDGSQQTIIPVGDMLKTWIVSNDPTSPIVLTKTEPSVAGQPETLSANLKLAPTDNIIGKDAQGYIYVRGSEIDNKIAVEKTARENADAALESAIQSEKDARMAADTVLQNNINSEANARHAADDELGAAINDAREEAANALNTKANEIYARIDLDEDKIEQASDDAAEAKSLVELTNANLEAEVNRATTAEGINAQAIADEINRATTAENAIATRVTTVETGLATERDTRSTADAVHDEQISNLRNAITSAEASHQEDIDRLSGEIAANASAISILNGSETTNGSVRETVKFAKDELNLAINNEKTRAEAKENELASDISAEIVRATSAEATVLANAKDYTDNAVSVASTAANVYTDNAKAEAIEISKAHAESKIAEAVVSVKEYTDHSIADSKHLSDDYTDAAKAEAIQTSKDYTDEKVATSSTDSKTYTDEKVAAEKARAEAAETANANEIVNLKAKDLEFEGELANKVESVTVVKNSQNDLQYILKVDGVDAGEINIPKDQFLQSVTYNTASKELVFTFETTEGTSVVNVSIADLVDTYLAGNGLVLSNNVFSVKINPASEFLSVDADGIKVSGINAALDTKANVGDSYTKAESDAKYLTEHQDLSGLENRVAANENAITIINGNEAQTGSIKKALKDANEYTDQKVEIEKNAREAVDALKANAADVYTKVEADNKFLTEHQDISNLATKAELSAETTRAEAAETANANEIVNLKAKDNEIDAELANKVEDVTIVKGDTDLIYRLMVDGVEKGIINIPEDQFLKNVSYSAATKEITFVFDTSEGEKTVIISVADLVDTYTAGNGLKLTDNQFSIVINEDSESYLTLTAEGLKISGIDAALATKANVGDSYTKAESDAKYLTEHQDISNLATKAEVNILDAKVEGYNTTLTDGVAANTSAITTLNSNALVDGSVDNKVKTAKDALEEEIATKANAADVYTKTEIDNKGYLTEHQDISNLATKVEVNTEVARLDAKDAELTTEVNKKIESVEVEKNSANDLQYIIKVDGTSVGTIDIPKDQFLKEVSYDAGNKAIVFTFETTEGTQVVNVSVADLVDTYTAGNGLKLENNQFSVLINEDSESYLTVTAEGIKISGIDAALATKANVGDSYTKDESDAKYLTEHQDISNLATKAEVNAEVVRLDAKDVEIEAKADVNAANIEIINGNESQAGSIKKALKDAKDYADAGIEAEKNRAITAETSNSDAIAIINGNESQAGSIKKALADAKAYTDAEVATEKNRAEAAENTLSDAIAIINGNEAQAGSIKKALKDAKDYTDTAVADEKTAREAADIEMNAAIDLKANKSEVYTKSEIEGKGYLTSTDIAGLATKEEVNIENARAVAAETSLASDITTANSNIADNTSDIAELQAEAARLNLIVDETNTVKLIKSKDNTGTELAANVKLDATNTNIIKVSGNGLYADVEMSYSQTTNKITFSNGLTTQVFELAGASLLEDGYYNSATKQIILITRLADGTTRQIVIDAEALIHTLKVDNGTNNPIKLSKTTDSEGVDVISARLDISTESHNQILNNNGTLYASNEATQHTALWNGNEKSLQEVIELLKVTAEEGSEAAQEIVEIKAELQEVERNLRAMESTVSSLSTRVSENTSAIAVNTGSINTLTSQMNEVNGKMAILEGKVTDVEELVDTYETRVSNLESDMTNVKSNVTSLINDVSTMQTQLGDISGLKTVAQRLEDLEQAVNDADYGTY